MGLSPGDQGKGLRPEGPLLTSGYGVILGITNLPSSSRRL